MPHRNITIKSIITGIPSANSGTCLVKEAPMAAPTPNERHSEAKMLERRSVPTGPPNAAANAPAIAWRILPVIITEL
jgi:hypothetical protein